jgi:hypothetical protein
MTSFVQGILEEKTCEYGSYCKLVFRLADSVTIPVFNSAPRGSSVPLSAQWTVGTEYHLLLKVRATHVTSFSTVPAGTILGTVTEEFQAGGKIFQQTNIAQGKVLDPFWDATEHPFQAVVSPGVYKQVYVLLETAIGNVLISRDDIASDLGEQVQQLTAGSYLEWEPGRIDLWALLPGVGEALQTADASAEDLALKQRYKGGKRVARDVTPQDSPASSVATFVQAQLDEVKCGITWCTFKLRIAPDVLVLATESKDVTKTDPGPLAAQMTIHAAYRLLLMVNALHPRYFPEMPASATLDVEYREEQFIDAHQQERFTSAYILEGKVLNPDWDAASQHYRAITDLPWFYRERYVLLETAIGHVVISHDHLERSLGAQQVAQIRTGGYIEWAPSRMTLLALL